MIDNAVILFSTLMCVIVVFRAIRLDGRLPWYGKESGTETPAIVAQEDHDAP